ncbi:hypothetical protein [Amycolatopsis sp. NPDC003861]
MKKFKFTLENRGDTKVDIGGGETSSIRLLVAYPKNFKPLVTIPDESSINSKYVSVANPPDVTVWLADNHRKAEISEVENGQELFAIPDDFRLWAIPAVPNYVVEQESKDSMTFATVVDRTEILPGEKFADARRGHGSWVFFMPLQRKFIDENLAIRKGIFVDDYSLWQELPRTTTKDTAPFFQILGIGLLAQQDSFKLIGFSPTPPDDELKDPSDL